MKKMYLLFVICLIFSSCNDGEKSNSPTVALIENSEKLVDKITFSDDYSNAVKFFRTRKTELYSKECTKENYEKIISDYETKFSKKVSFSYDEFNNAKQALSKSMRNSKVSQQLDEKVFSKSAIELVNKIRDELNLAQTESDLKDKFNLCKKLVSENPQISDNEKKLFGIKLDMLEDIASAETKNGRMKDINEGPSCKWWQWGCVFYFSSAQVGVLLTIWVSGSDQLKVLVSEYGINYIAQCCGFCGCKCPDGCP